MAGLGSTFGFNCNQILVPNLYLPKIARKADLENHDFFSGQSVAHCGKRVVNRCRNSQTLLLYNYIVNFEDLRGRWIFFTIIFICIEAQN